MALILLSYIVQIPIPYLIKEYLDWIADGDSGQLYGWVLTFLVSFITLLKPITYHQGMKLIFRVAIRSEVLTRSLIVNKSLNMPPGVQNFIDIGGLSTLLTSDAKNLSMSIMIRGHIYLGPILLVVYTALLWLQISWVSIFAPIIIVLIAI